ncbi:sugar phosphate isomerase/epimerase family protein [Streptomyces sp. B6B3]|uniref:sugar phosphate isomerase/epimerase family protein n=1 Tax=Streptomyces sp. B6B3 TaxID=3153570 RepID=UPI00325D8C11
MSTPAHPPRAHPAADVSPGRHGDTGRQDRPQGLRFAYGTNGLTDLRLTDAVRLLADLGYQGVAVTLDHMHLDPCAPDLLPRAARLGRDLDRIGLGAAVETGARYVLDPTAKHGPSLLDPDPDARARRVRLLLDAVAVAAELRAGAVHCFSGITPPGTSEEAAWDRLTGALGPVLAAARRAGVPLAVEPEPGMLLDTTAAFHRLRERLGDPPGLALTLDIGHLRCLESEPIPDLVRAAAPWVAHVQIEDMRRGVHEHLPFGEGEIDFPPVLAALADTGYDGLVSVELPRHSHAGPALARSSIAFLRRATATAQAARTPRPTDLATGLAGTRRPAAAVHPAARRDAAAC